MDGLAYHVREITFRERMFDVEHSCARKKTYERLSRILGRCYGPVMSSSRKRLSLPERQWAMLAALVRLGARFGQWPSRGELARELRLHPDTVRTILKTLESEGLAVCIRRSGWMPTAEGLRWRGLEMPRLEPGCAPPRSARWAGVGAVRAWNRKQRLKTRLAAVSVFDAEGEAPGTLEAFE